MLSHLTENRHLQDGVKRFLAAVALALLYSYGLRRTVVLDAVKVQVEAGNFLETLGRFHELGVAH